LQDEDNEDSEGGDLAYKHLGQTTYEFVNGIEAFLVTHFRRMVPEKSLNTLEAPPPILKVGKGGLPRCVAQESFLYCVVPAEY
jgi:hypothetical protein